MSDSPRTTLSLWQELQKTKRELAAALSDAKSWEQQASNRVDDCLVQIARADRAEKRIAELTKLLREVLSSGCEYETKKYKVVQVDQTLWSAINESIK